MDTDSEVYEPEASFIPVTMGQKTFQLTGAIGQSSSFWHGDHGSWFWVSSYSKIKHQVWVKDILQPWGQA